MTIKPYYEDGFITLYHGDCSTPDAIATWAGADVMVTDPPYGMAYQSNMVKGRAKNPVAGDQDTTVRDRVIDTWQDGPGGMDRPALVFGRWDITRPAGVRHRLIWSKGDSPGMGNLRMPWGPSDEEIYVLGSGFVGKRSSNVIVVNTPPPNNRDPHPTPKPVALMERLIEKCPPGVIADPFAGSGSTLVAAKALGRRVIGWELEERYVELIANRVSQEALVF